MFNNIEYRNGEWYVQFASDGRMARYVKVSKLGTVPFGGNRKYWPMLCNR